MSKQNIRTDTEALAFVRQMAEANPRLRDKDYDALREVGEADTETILRGYLWQAVEHEMGDMSEDTEELLTCAICDFFTDMLSAESDGDTIRQMFALGYDGYYLFDVAFAISEGNDYDEECQKATDKIAQALGLPTMADCYDTDSDPYDDPTYEFVNKAVNVAVSWYDYWEGEEEDTGSILTVEKLRDLLTIAEEVGEDEAIAIVAGAQ